MNRSTRLLPNEQEFAEMEKTHSGRIRRVHDKFADLGIDSFLITDLISIRYLTGFTGSNALAWVRPDQLTVMTDGRYTTQIAQELDAAGVEAEIVITRDNYSELSLRVRPGEKVGLEAESISWAMQRSLASKVFDPANLIPTDSVIVGLRATKTAEEIDYLTRACAIADRALAATRSLLDERLSEKEFALALERAMADAGSDGPSFETIVASGPNGGKPHHQPTDRVIGSSESAELVVIDFGATVSGYHSDMTRTYVADPNRSGLSEQQQRMFDVVRESQRVGRELVGPGVGCQEVDRACRDVIDAAGWGAQFSHGTGHGIGLVIHELPRVSQESSDVLEPGHCMTVEPGVYLGGVAGVRIEDSLVVTAEGATVMTKSPYT